MDKYLILFWADTGSLSSLKAFDVASFFVQRPRLSNCQCRMQMRHDRQKLQTTASSVRRAGRIEGTADPSLPIQPVW